MTCTCTNCRTLALATITGIYLCIICPIIFTFYAIFPHRLSVQKTFCNIKMSEVPIDIISLPIRKSRQSKYLVSIFRTKKCVFSVLRNRIFLTLHVARRHICIHVAILRQVKYHKSPFFRIILSVISDMSVTGSQFRARSTRLIDLFINNPPAVWNVPPIGLSLHILSQTLSQPTTGTYLILFNPMFIIMCSVFMIRFPRDVKLY